MDKEIEDLAELVRLKLVAIGNVDRNAAREICKSAILVLSGEQKRLKEEAMRKHASNGSATI